MPPGSACGRPRRRLRQSPNERARHRRHARTGPCGGHGRARGGPHADGDGAPRRRLQRSDHRHPARAGRRGGRHRHRPRGRRAARGRLDRRRAADARRVDVGSRGTQFLLAAMARHGVRRVVCVTCAGAVDAPGPRGFLRDRVLRPLLRKAIGADRDRQETLRGSAVDWTIVQPAALTSGPATGLYQTVTDDAPGRSSASRVRTSPTSSSRTWPRPTTCTRPSCWPADPKARGPTAVDSRVRAGRMPPVRRVGESRNLCL